MKIKWKIDEIAKTGMLGGSSTKFKVWVKAEYSAEEQGITSRYGSYCPWVLDHFEASEYTMDRLRKVLPPGKSTFQDAFEFEFDSIQLANKFRIAAIETVQHYKNQIEITRSNVEKLRQLCELDLTAE